MKNGSGRKGYKHPQIFADTLTLCQLYYPMHNNLPKPFRFSVGDRILQEMAECLRLIVLANTVDKKCDRGRRDGSAHIRRLRASIEVIKGYFLLAWKLKFISHGGTGELSVRLETISKQAARWQQWFDNDATFQ